MGQLAQQSISCARTMSSQQTQTPPKMLQGRQMWHEGTWHIHHAWLCDTHAKTITCDSLNSRSQADGIEANLLTDVLLLDDGVRHTA